jgi:hypothetical protein
MVSAVAAISVIPALICSAGDGDHLVDQVLDVGHEVVEVGGQFGHLVAAVHLQAGGEIALAFGDVAHAHLDLFQGLDDGAAQQHRAGEADPHHAEAQGQHAEEAQPQFPVDTIGVHDQHQVVVLAGIGARHVQGGAQHPVAGLDIAGMPVGQGLGHGIAFQLGVVVELLLEGHHLPAALHHRHAGQTDVLVGLDEAERVLGDAGGVALVAEHVGGDGLAQHARQAAGLDVHGVGLGAADHEPRRQHRRHAQDSGEGEEGIGELFPDGDTVPVQHQETS